MDYVEFLTDLFEEGRVTVSRFAPVPPEDLDRGDALLAKYEQVHRAEMPGQAPDFVAGPARWAAVQLFQGCRGVVYRDAGETVLQEFLDRDLSQVNPQPVTAGVHYSVDVVFRYLPDLVRFARSAAEQDPLVDRLLHWGTAWPLSSVGIDGLGEYTIDGFANCDVLMRLYVDRVISSGDVSRLRDKRVHDHLRGVLGNYPELSEPLRSALESSAKEEDE